MLMSPEMHEDAMTLVRKHPSAPIRWIAQQIAAKPENDGIDVDALVKEIARAIYLNGL